MPKCNVAFVVTAASPAFDWQNLRRIYAIHAKCGFCVYALLLDTAHLAASSTPTMAFQVSASCPAALAGLLLTAAQPLHAAEVSGTAAVTSDYVFRGVSQSQGDPALQASLRIDAGNGFYGYAWASTIDFPSAPAATAEVDFVMGWQRKLGANWVGDVNATWFTYPSDSADLDYLEMIVTATYRDRTWLLIGASNDVFATGRTGIYVQTGTRIPLSDSLRLELVGGYYRLASAYGRSYAHGQLTAAWLMRPSIELRVTAHATDARALFGDIATSRIEAAIQASF